jgi:hypothetical protein
MKACAEPEPRHSASCMFNGPGGCSLMKDSDQGCPLAPRQEHWRRVIDDVMPRGRRQRGILSSISGSRKKGRS